MAKEMKARHFQKF